jgi:hypothetical protein
MNENWNLIFYGVYLCFTLKCSECICDIEDCRVCQTPFECPNCIFEKCCWEISILMQIMIIIRWIQSNYLKFLKLKIRQVKIKLYQKALILFLIKTIYLLH